MSVGDYITRSEYEARHAELRTEMLHLGATTDAIRSDIQARFDLLTAKIEKFDDAQTAKLEKMDEKIDSAQVAAWKVVALSAANFIVGGGMMAVFQYFHPLR